MDLNPTYRGPIDLHTTDAPLKDAHLHLQRSRTTGRLYLKLIRIWRICHAYPQTLARESFDEKIYSIYSLMAIVVQMQSNGTAKSICGYAASCSEWVWSL